MFCLFNEEKKKQKTKKRKKSISEKNSSFENLSISLKNKVLVRSQEGDFRGIFSRILTKVSAVNVERQLFLRTPSFPELLPIAASEY